MLYKRLKKWKLAGDLTSVVFAKEGITIVIPTATVSLIAVTAASILIEVYVKHKNVEKLNQCQYAFQTYGHLLNEIKDCLRSSEFNSQEFYIKMQFTDDFILENSSIVDKWVTKYDKLFTFLESFESHYRLMHTVPPNRIHIRLTSSLIL